MCCFVCTSSTTSLCPYERAATLVSLFILPVTLVTTLRMMAECCFYPCGILCLGLWLNSGELQRSCKVRQISGQLQRERGSEQASELELELEQSMLYGAQAACPGTSYAAAAWTL